MTLPPLGRIEARHTLPAASPVRSLNFKHLRYFWAVAKSGGIARASEQLHLTPQTISGQISLFEEALGYKLFERVGRRLELSDAGRSVLSYADQIFTLGRELEAVLRNPASGRPLPFRVGVADAVAKGMAYRLLEPSLRLEEPLRIICVEGKLADLLAQLAVHRLDIVISDTPMPAALNVKGFNHFLGECGFTFLATVQLKRSLAGVFPRSLDRAPLLLPNEDAAARPRLMRWFEQQHVSPRIVGEFEDGALLKAFGRAGVGIFPVPSAIAKQVCRQYGVTAIGRTEAVTDAFYAISVERRLKHPAVVAITAAARKELFGHRGE